MLSLEIFRIFGVPVRFHWSFSVLACALVFYSIYHDLGSVDVISLITFVFALILSLILHEIGHAYVAKRVGSALIDMIISPIGGVVRLSSLPIRVLSEVSIMIAGPIVNLLISISLSLCMYFYLDGLAFLSVTGGVRAITTVSGFFGLLIWANGLLFVLNMLPIYPLDGGRALKAMLAGKVGVVSALRWMMVISTLFTLALAGYGFCIRDYIISMLAFAFLVISLLSVWKKIMTAQ